MPVWFCYSYGQSDIEKKFIYLGITPIEVINTDDDLENKFCQCSDQIGFPILCSCQFGNKVQTKAPLFGDDIRKY